MSAWVGGWLRWNEILLYRIGGWVGGWIRGEEGDSHKLLWYMIGGWVGGWVGGLVKRAYVSEGSLAL